MSRAKLDVKRVTSRANYVSSSFIKQHHNIATPRQQQAIVMSHDHLIDFYWAQYRSAVQLYQEEEEIETAADKLKSIVTNPVVPRFCRVSSWMLLALCNWKYYDLAEEYLKKAETLCEEMARIDMSPKVEVYIQSTRRYQQQLEASKSVRPAAASKLPSPIEDDAARNMGVRYDTTFDSVPKEELIVAFAAGSLVAEDMYPKSYQDVLSAAADDDKNNEDVEMPNDLPAA